MSFLYEGKELPGTDRVAGHFMDGIFIRVAMVVNRHVTILDQFAHEIHTDPIELPQGWVTRSIGCIRSAQTGKLIVTLGGLYANTGTQRAMVLATDYFIQPPAVYQG